MLPMVMLQANARRHVVPDCTFIGIQARDVCHLAQLRVRRHLVPDFTFKFEAGVVRVVVVQFSGCTHERYSIPFMLLGRSI